MWTEQRLKKYREKAEISRFKPFEHEIRWHGYKMATFFSYSENDLYISIWHNDEISREEYDEWRYRYPELDTSQHWANTPSKEISDYLIKKSEK